MRVKTVVDLFCGAGGLSSGFKKLGYSVTSVDLNPHVAEVFRENELGPVLGTDLSKQVVNGGFDAVIGGPPCKPWSSINVTRREADHRDFSLLSRFFLHVKVNQPAVYLLENVPPVRPFAERRAARLRSMGYDYASRTIRYSDFGAPTSRARLILFGTREGNPNDFFDRLVQEQSRPRTVRDAIGHLSDVPEGAVPDHVFPKLKTLRKYRKYYESGKFGWHILNWDRPAPSFGNVVKTYTMHPTGWSGNPPRVISVKEALLLMGYDDVFRFPAGIGLKERYQMAVDSVSPPFSSAVAKVIQDWP